MFVVVVGELYTVVCSPTDATLVATGGGDDKGFMWRIGQGDWAVELQGMRCIIRHSKFNICLLTYVSPSNKFGSVPSHVKIVFFFFISNFCFKLIICILQVTRILFQVWPSVLTDNFLHPEASMGLFKYGTQPLVTLSAYLMVREVASR